MQVNQEAARVDYPEEGEKVGQSILHGVVVFALFDMVRRLLRDRGGFVAHDLFIYYQEGDNRTMVAPDLLVKSDYGKSRGAWKIWEDGIPDLVGEVCSDSNGTEDVTRKLELYQRLGIRYYFVFDPDRIFVREGLRAWELKGTRYERLAVLGSTAYFPALEMGVRMEGERLRVVDATGRPVRTAEEEKEARMKAEQERLLESLARQEEARGREEAERSREEAERRREEAERRREEAERELESLRARLGSLEGKT